MCLDTVPSKLKRMMGCKVLMDWKAPVRDVAKFWTCNQHVLEEVTMVLTAEVFCNSHSTVQKKKQKFRHGMIKG